MGKPASTRYKALGGAEAFLRLSKRFHERVTGDAGLRKLFPRDMTALEERLALFLGEQVGGPNLYTAKRGKTSLQCRHAHLSISADDAESWLRHMFAAMEEVGIGGPGGDDLRVFLSETARLFGDPFHSLYGTPLDELRSLLQAHPELAAQCHNGRTLLGAACLRWDLARVEVLLSFGADVHRGGGLDHDALYQTARGGSFGREGDGAAIIESLVRHGSDVNRRSGPGRGTALHMAARRGHRQIAIALLDAGAEIDLQDAKGATPLLRAVNCGKREVVELLLVRNADFSLPDKAGILPIDAARNESIRSILLIAISTKGR